VNLPKRVALNEPHQASRPAVHGRRAARRVLLLGASGAWLASLLAACDRPSGAKPFKSIDLTGADYGRRVDLPDLQGKPRTLEDFRGKLVVLFFGYTQCPDVCPSTLATMAEVMKLLGDDANRVQVIFVTVDPERDTAEVLTPYVKAFDSRFMALRGSPEQIDVVRKEFRVIVQRNKGATPSSYTIDHTAASYVIGTDGRLRLYIRHDTPVADIAADLKRLLS
jgi:protein SCO1/2